MMLDPGPGCGLLMPQLWGPSSVVEAVDRHARLRAATGLPDRLLSAPLWASCAVPLLSRTEARLVPSDLSVAGHPLLWLPDRLLDRYQLVDDELGVTTTETDDTWVVRVLLEAGDAGWLDRGTGQWVDVLERAGVSRERAQDWMSGAPDAQLDDLAAPLATQSDWAIDMAQQLLPHLRAGSDALGALEVDSALRASTDSPDMLRRCALAGSLLGVVEGQATAVSLWRDLYDHPDRPGPLRRAREHLERLVEEGRHSLDQLADLVTGEHSLA